MKLAAMEQNEYGELYGTRRTGFANLRPWQGLETRKAFSCILPRGLPFSPCMKVVQVFLDQPHFQLRQTNPMLTVILSRIF